jgi:hypothetical protein
MSIWLAYQIHNKLAGGGRHGTMGAWIPQARECSRSQRLRPLSASPVAPSCDGCSAVGYTASGSAPCGPSRPKRSIVSRPKAGRSWALPRARSWPAATRARARNAAGRSRPPARPATAALAVAPATGPGCERRRAAEGCRPPPANESPVPEPGPGTAPGASRSAPTLPPATSVPPPWRHGGDTPSPRPPAGYAWSPGAAGHGGGRGVTRTAGPQPRVILRMRTV